LAGLLVPGAAALAVTYDNPILQILADHNCRLLATYQKIADNYAAGVDKENAKYDKTMAKLETQQDQANALGDIAKVAALDAKMAQEDARHEAALDKLAAKRDQQRLALSQQVVSYLAKLGMPNALSVQDLLDLFP
jgi:hypothetical protein